MPPPEPVLSTIGVLNFDVLPNCSATVVEKGKTVDEPTIRIWSRASAAPIVTNKIAAKNESVFKYTIGSPIALV